MPTSPLPPLAGVERFDRFLAQDIASLDARLAAVIRRWADADELTLVADLLALRRTLHVVVAEGDETDVLHYLGIAHRRLRGHE